jgi:hypothetical protein
MTGDIIRLWLCKLLKPEGWEVVKEDRVVRESEHRHRNPTKRPKRELVEVQDE